MFKFSIALLLASEVLLEAPAFAIKLSDTACPRLLKREISRSPKAASEEKDIVVKQVIEDRDLYLIVHPPTNSETGPEIILDAKMFEDLPDNLQLTASFECENGSLSGLPLSKERDDEVDPPSPVQRLKITLKKELGSLKRILVSTGKHQFVYNLETNIPEVLKIPR